jgi:coatomer protein complex subunit gamma
VGLNE